MLTNFSAAGWAPQPDAAVNDRFIRLGTRGNLGDRADMLVDGHRFAVARGAVDQGRLRHVARVPL